MEGKIWREVGRVKIQMLPVERVVYGWEDMKEVLRVNIQILPVEMVVYGIEDMEGGGKGNNTNIT